MINTWDMRKKLVARCDDLITTYDDWYSEMVGYCCIITKVASPYFFLMNPCIKFPYFLFITQLVKSFSLYISDKTTSWVSSGYFVVYFIHHRQQQWNILSMQLHILLRSGRARSFLNLAGLDFFESSFLATVLIICSHCVSINFFFWKPFLLFFFRLFYLSTRFTCLLSLDQFNMVVAKY